MVSMYAQDVHRIQAMDKDKPGERQDDVFPSRVISRTRQILHPKRPNKGQINAMPRIPSETGPLVAACGIQPPPRSFASHVIKLLGPG